ncbi:Cysteine alpha-hairpin motif superfamily [Corchorus olitorius]|uniref:Cysteine alpha-hairpin motif superfamily n=1 Tax=Corchorus olitorius TaxID=93759 RepID=A0A1R3GHP9_9ROSI|nr:Cysteine alpha-hairpin motif superfamily [Corchorus olitorius]
MPRRSRSSGRSSGGWSASRPRPRPAAARAPSSNPPPTPKPAASAPPPTPKHTSNPPPTPKPAASAPPPAPVQREYRSGGFGAAIVDGLGWGMGSGIGHRAAEAIFGPRVVRHETVASPKSAAAATAAPVPNTNSMANSDACGGQSKALSDCLNNYGSDISKCQFYMDILQECRKSSGSVLSA